MLEILKIETDNQAQVKEFVHFPYRLYANTPQWVPPLLMDAELPLKRHKHPFYDHSDADFFLAKREGKVVGRLAVLENRRFNQHHATKNAQFYCFECEENGETAEAMFSRAIEWAQKRGLDKMVGPKGFNVLDGYGLQIEGYEHRTIMTMMNYNFSYYPQLLEAMGFEKEVDFVSCYAYTPEFHLPERIHRIADRVRQRGTLKVEEFTTKAHLRKWADKIGKAYNQTFINNWEFTPLTEKEIAMVLENILVVADPRLIKIITHKENVVGFLLGFPDLSRGMQKANGRLFPFGMVNLLQDMRRTDWLAVNGIGVLPEFHGAGGNALLYSELDKTMHAYNGRFKHVDMTQVAETAIQMRRDLINLGGKPYKTHRVYHKSI